MRTLSFVVALVVALASPAAADEVVDAFSVEFDEVVRLLRSVDEAGSRDRDGLAARVDARGIDLLRRINAAAPEQLAADTLDDSARTAWLMLLDRGAQFVRERDEMLADRAADERDNWEKFERSAQADIARAFVEDLRQMRRDYASVFVEQAELRRDAGLDAEEMFAEVRAAIRLALEQVTGQIVLDAMSLEELRARVADDPLDTELAQAFELVEAKQERSLRDLERLIALAGRLDIDVSEQRGILISERGALGVEILDRDVFADLLGDQLDALRTRVMTDGPNVVFRAVLLAAILALTWMLARMLRGVVRRLVARDGLGISRLARAAVVSVSVTVMWVIGVVVGLAAIGVSLGPLFAGVGVLGIVVGFAVQDSLANLASGVMILVFRPFDVDDHIKVAGAEGLVKRMNFLATTIATFDNKVLIVPNGRIWGDTIENLSVSKVRRVDIEVGFSYDADPVHVEAVLLEVLEGYESVLDTPPPAVHFTRMGDSALVMKVKPWVRTVDYWTTYWGLNHAIFKRFAEEGIEIPYPQRVVHMVPTDAGHDAPAVDAFDATEAPSNPTSVREDDEPDDGEET